MPLFGKSPSVSNLLVSAKFICATKLSAPFSFDGQGTLAGRSGYPPNLNAPTAVSPSSLACVSIFIAFLAIGFKNSKSPTRACSLQPLEIFLSSKRQCRCDTFCSANNETNIQQSCRPLRASRAPFSRHIHLSLRSHQRPHLQCQAP